MIDWRSNPNYYQGTGRYESVPEMAGHIKPLLFGTCKAIKPICISWEKQVWQVHSGRIEIISSVYYNGRGLLNWGNEDDLFADDVTEFLAGLPAKAFMTDLERGAFRLNFNPYDGMITCDASGPSVYMPDGLEVWK